MKVMVDGMDDLVRLEEFSGATLEDFLNSLNTFVTGNGRVVTRITIDGRSLTPPFVDEVFSQSISSIGETAIETEPVNGLIIETLDEVDKHIGECINEFTQAAEIIYARQYRESADLIAKAVEKWRYCLRALDMILALALNKDDKFNEATTRERYRQTQEVIAQMAEALQNGDFMMVKDVIDYELLDKLTEIRTLKDDLKAFFLQP